MAKEKLHMKAAKERFLDGCDNCECVIIIEKIEINIEGGDGVLDDVGPLHWFSLISYTSTMI